MSTQTSTLDIRHFLNKHVQDVFETMLSLKATPAAKNDLPHFPERVTGSVGMGGENVTGAIYLHLSDAFAKQAAAGMLGLTTEEITGENEVNDVIGEMTNMIAGGFKSHLCDIGNPCAISTPAIIRGNFEIEALQDVQREWAVFDCGSERVAVEVHIKFN
jgi:chemotaxis protein CheX